MVMRKMRNFTWTIFEFMKTINGALEIRNSLVLKDPESKHCNEVVMVAMTVR